MPSAERSAVLLDQHPLWLDAVDAVVSRTGMRVLEKTSSPSRALAVVGEQQPDLLVLETETVDADLDGLGCLREVRGRSPTTRAIVLSARQDPENIDAALDAGAVAYVIKTAHSDDVALAIRQAFQHSVFFASARRSAPALEPVAPHPETELTRRELEILRLVAEGHSNSQLARMLWVTEQTVKFHLSNVYRKLGVANRTEASRWAQRNGLLATAPPSTEAR